MEQSMIIMVKGFNNWCKAKGVKNSFVNFIWWKDNIMNKKEK